jgi:uncharacterized protein with NRDE domain
MCTIIFIHGVARNMPIIVAANRDENPNRPSLEPADIGHGVFAPIDQLFGGSWIGINDNGLLVAVTNRHSGNQDAANRRSRGLLVTETLRNATSAADAICRLVTEVNPEFNPFHLVMADRRQAAIAWSDGKKFTASWAKTGIQVITDQGFANRHSVRDSQIRQYLQRTPDPYCLESLKSALSIHGHNPESGTCIHGNGVARETVFSSVIALVEEPRVAPRWDFHKYDRSHHH